MKHQHLELSPEDARLLFLNNQGLLNPETRKGKKGTLDSIQHLGYIQIDTISVIARAHHHTLWNRIADYKESYLNELQEKDKTIFEYWSHAASYLPMADYRFSLPQKKLYADGKSHWFEQDKKMKKYVLDRIKSEGEMQAKDFEHSRDSAAKWYEWKPAKASLEQLFMEGKLMVARRQGFQKVYDLTERVLPPGIITTFPADKEYAEHLIRKSIQANGIVTLNEISYLRSGIKETLNKVVKNLIEQEEIREIKIKGINDSTFLTNERELNSIENIKPSKEVRMLSPFDNAVIQRKRLFNLFNFDYLIECYLPESKRTFGYFSLPVLYNNRFVARTDTKADRASKTFFVHSVHFEKGFLKDDEFNFHLSEKIKAFATFNGCNKIELSAADKKWQKEMKSILKRK